MTEFVIRLHGGIDGPTGTLTVDGAEPDLFGELVGCKIERVMPVEPPGAPTNPLSIRPYNETLTVEVTLRLPMGRSDHLTLVRDASIETYHGPASDVRSTGPGAVALLDRWLYAHPGEPGGALIAKARELLAGRPAPQPGIDAREFRVDTFSSDCDQAVRVTHLPTGTTVTGGLHRGPHEVLRDCAALVAQARREEAGG